MFSSFFCPAGIAGKVFLCLSLIANVIIVWPQCKDPLKVCLYDSGCYIGKYMRSFRENEVDAFLGIPYAFPSRRFEPPQRFYGNQTHSSWWLPPDCMNKNYFAPGKPISGSEDCLYLNVYRPTAKHFYLLPVLVYFHGGGYFTGTSNQTLTGPDYIMDYRHIILITVNYRLGPFGFMGTRDGALPGNLGLKDQAEALYWVSRNIESFGGDRFRVTLMGHDAGGASVQMHMFSRLSRFTFSAIISISGTPNAVYSLDLTPERTARQTARFCNITSWDAITTTALANALERVDANDLLNAGDHLKYWDIDNLVTYRPMVERNVPTAFLIYQPSTYLRYGQYFPVPILYGRVPNEGALRAVAIMENDDLRRSFNSQFNELLMQMLELPLRYNESKRIAVTKVIISEYLGGISELNDGTIKNFMNLLTDRFYYYPLYNTIKYHVEVIDNSKYPMFWYNFNYRGPHSFAATYAGHAISRDYGVIHYDDLIYLFRTHGIFPDFGWYSMEAKVISAYVDFIIHFATTRAPPIVDARYKPCTNSTFFPGSGKICDYFEIVNDLNETVAITLNNNWNTARMRFWDDIIL